VYFTQCVIEQAERKCSLCAYDGNAAMPAQIIIDGASAEVTGVDVDSANNVAYVVDRGGPLVLTVNLTTRMATRFALVAVDEEVVTSDYVDVAFTSGGAYISTRDPVLVGIYYLNRTTKSVSPWSTGSDRVTNALVEGDQATAAKFEGPSGLDVDAAGNLLINETNFKSRVRLVDAATGSLRRVAGTDDKYGGSGLVVGDATATQLNGPLGVSFGPGGTLFISDTYKYRILKVKLACSRP
jgi:hypothetical protein